LCVASFGQQVAFGGLHSDLNLDFFIGGVQRGVCHISQIGESLRFALDFDFEFADLVGDVGREHVVQNDLRTLTFLRKEEERRGERKREEERRERKGNE
jgi:hypothetical protein